MADGVLKDWRSGGRDRLLWVEYDEYARRVFAGSPPHWWRDAVGYSGTLAQAHRVVPSDVITVDALSPCLVAWRDDPSAFAGQSPAERAQALLAGAAARAFVAEALDALAHRFAGRADLVLRLLAPADLLRACGAPAGEDPGFDAMDDTAVALANHLRAFADRPVAGLLLESAAPVALSPDEREACDPLLGAAGHYGWTTALALPACTAAADGTGEGFDLALLPEVGAGDLGQDRRRGGALPASTWRERDAVPAPLPRGLRYGRIDPDAEPELVVERMRGLVA